MNRKNIFGYAILVAIIILLSWYFIFFTKQNKVLESVHVNTEQKSLSYEDPFAFMEIPENITGSARERFLDEINGVRKMYQEKPSIWETWIAIGNVYNMLGKHEYAIDAYLKSLELEGSNIVAHRNIAEVYRVGLGNEEKAAQYYKNAINNNYSDLSLYLSLSKIQHKKLNQLDGAEKTLLEGLQKTGGHPDVLVAIITLYEDSGQIQKQKEAVKALFARFPDNELYKKTWGDLVE